MLSSFAAASEDSRQEYSFQLNEAKMREEGLNNQNQLLTESNKITTISQDLITDKLEMLFKSIDAISNAKNLEDYYVRIISG